MSQASKRTTDRQPPVIVWFRHDLRLADNPALRAAPPTRPPSSRSTSSTMKPRPGPPGGASRWWLHHSLRALPRARARSARAGASAAAQRRAGARLARGDRRDARLLEPPLRAAPSARATAPQGGARATRHRGRRASTPPAARAVGGRPQAAASRSRCSRRSGARCASVGAPPRAAGRRALGAACSPAGSQPIALDALRLLPTQPDWAGGLREPGRRAKPAPRAARALPRTRLAGYADSRDRPDRAARRGCRRICISARSGRARSGTRRARCGRRQRPARRRARNSSPSSAGASSPTTCCSTFPTSPTRNCAAELRALPLGADAARCAAWQRGRPAIRSSMPACASSGAPAGCTTACA